MNSALNDLGLNEASSKLRSWYRISLRKVICRPASGLWPISLWNSGVNPFLSSPSSLNLTLSAVGDAVQGCFPGGYFGSSFGSPPVLVGAGSEVLVGGMVEVGRKDEVLQVDEADRTVDVGSAGELDNENEVDSEVELEGEVEVGCADGVVPFGSPGSLGWLSPCLYGKA